MSPTQASYEPHTFLFRHHTSITDHLILPSVPPDSAGTTTIGALGAATTPPTKRNHRNWAILEFSLIHKKNENKIKIIKQKEKCTFCSANTQSVSYLYSDPFSCPAPPLQSRGSSEMPPTPVSQTIFLSIVFTCLARNFSLTQVHIYNQQFSGLRSRS